MKKGVVFTLAGAAALVVSSLVWAANNNDVGNITIYSQPNAQSKVIEKINGDAPLMTIFIDKDWSKVGDPSNGQTGWVKNSDMQNATKSVAAKSNQTTKTTKTDDGVQTVTKGVVQTQYGPMHYEITQFQGKSAPNNKEAKAFFNKMQKMQIDMNNAFANSWGDMDSMQANMMKMMGEQQHIMMQMDQPTKTAVKTGQPKAVSSATSETK
ncbi:TPA: SH3 domain-containing protein [Photobacterium damselae]